MLRIRQLLQSRFASSDCGCPAVESFCRFDCPNLNFDLSDYVSYDRFLMNFRLTGLNWLCAAGCGVLLCLPSTGVAQGRSSSRSQPIIFSETRSSTVVSNLDSAAPRRETIHKLDEQIQRPNDAFRPSEAFGNVSQPAFIRAPAPTVSSKSLMELIRKDRERKDWVFTQPEDNQLGLTAEEMFSIRDYGADGTEKKKASPLESFMERQRRERAMGTNQIGAASATDGYYDSFSDDPNGRKDDDSSPFFEGKSRSRKAMSTDPDGLFSPEAVAPGVTWNPFGVQSLDTSAKDAAKESRMQDFNSLFKPLAGVTSGGDATAYDPGTLGSVGGYSPLSGILPASASAVSTSSKLFISPTPTAGSMFASPVDSMTSPARPLGLPEVAASPVSPSLTPALPAVQEPPRQAMPQPVFSMPQRKF